MGRDKRHAERVRAANRAKAKAVKRLIAENPERYKAIYAEEAKKEQVTPNWELHTFGADREKRWW